jgi:hypothetical protein
MAFIWARFVCGASLLRYAPAALKDEVLTVE